MNTMTFDVDLPLGFDDTIQQVEAALKAEQFGIISRIDLHATFKQKLNVDGLPHTILGACNPKLAHKAVSTMPAAAVMLPCNVTVQAIENGAHHRAYCQSRCGHGPYRFRKRTDCTRGERGS